MPLYFLYLTKNPNTNILCLLGSTDFKVKAKFNVSVRSDAINQSKSIDITTKRFQHLVHSEARTRYHNAKISLQIHIDFLVKCANILFSIVPDVWAVFEFDVAVCLAPHVFFSHRN